MTTLSIQQIMGTKYRTSSKADALTRGLMEHMGLSTKAAVARLSIGRSLSAGALASTETVDSKGLDIPATSLFRQEEVAAWVGLIITHEQQMSGAEVNDMEGFRNLVRRHWHRGVHLLNDDWMDSDGNYDNFINVLVTRRAELSEDVYSPEGETISIIGTAKEDISETLSKALNEIGVSAEIKSVIHGPRVSRYKTLIRDVKKLDKLKRSLKELALVLNIQDTLTVAAGDEARTVFLDIPRPKKTWVTYGKNEFEIALRAISPNRDQLILLPAVDIMGDPITFDLTVAPHLLVAGATGQGKSVCIHALIISLLEKHDKTSLQLALIDPKQVEFSVYKNIKSLWRDKIAVGSDAARETLDELVEEMEKRYSALEKLDVNNIVDGRKSGLDLPFIVACIDELADLILQDDQVETLLARLAQKGRSCGIHLILATQRPDSKTISGLIRSNVPARIALRVQRGSESSIILDGTGAENLLGAGDMLLKTSGGDPQRAHGYLLSLKEVQLLIKGR
jgi:S-DNA-T family DNA segregation ATPase FtsK/SpoIIIE